MLATPPKVRDEPDESSESPACNDASWLSDVPQLMMPATAPPQNLLLSQYTTAECVLLHSTVQYVHHRAFQTQTLRRMIVHIGGLIFVASMGSMNSLYL